MAKLSARGRLELARVSKERPIDDPEQLIVWERTTLALMSDGRILKKRDVQFKPNPILKESKGQKHTWGWKEFGKVKADVTPEVFLNAYLKVGYSKE